MSKTNKVVAVDFGGLVDRLGKLNAQVAPVLDEIAEIKQQLRDSGFDVVEGKAFRATIGETADKAYVDYKAIAATLPAKKLAALVDKFTTFKEALGQVRVVAKVR